ncbi:MAG: DEAD/DEAH box helicase [Actinomycetes bacterium]
MTDAADVTFADLDLREELQRALSSLGYEEPTPIQCDAIPVLLAGRDAMAQAATGTGKTAAFALPILQLLESGHRPPEPTALVLVPTRELCMQVSEAMHRYGRDLNVRCLPIYGGQPIVRQLRELKRGVDVVIATPGRAVDHIKRGTLALDRVRVVVLDEADEMLDMGFQEDLEMILDATPTSRQTVLFSATMPSRINNIARKYLNNPARIHSESAPVAHGESPAVRQTAYMVSRANKTAALGRILDIESPVATIVFCRTRDEVNTLTETLNGRGYRAAALHGGVDQSQRERVIARLRSGSADLIVATDVAARGLDIDQLTHVVNFDVPSAPESYVHRIGRVGRAGRAGVAITLAEPREHRILKTIQRVTGNDIIIEKLPTVADLQTRRLEMTREALVEALAADDLDMFRGVVESLGDEHDFVEIALAAVRLAHEATNGPIGGDDIPDEAPPVGGEHSKKHGDRKEHGKDRLKHHGKENTKDHGKGNGKKSHSADGGGGGITRVQINLGKEAGIRPQDVVGAIANETGMKGREVGGIEISDRFTVVEVPRKRAKDVVAALSATHIRGRKPKARVLPDR